jgi:hypothetical protein
MKSENINIIPYWKIIAGLNYFKENDAKNILDFLLFINETVLKLYQNSKEICISDLIFINSMPTIYENKISKKLIINDNLIEDEEINILDNKFLFNKKINLYF